MKQLAEEEQRLMLEYELSKYADSLKVKYMSFDASRTRRLKEMLGDKPWFSKESVGNEGLEVAAFLLMQTNDDAFMKHALPEIEKQAQRGDLPKKWYAFLLDRVRWADSLPLVYGTVTQKVDGKYIPYPTEDSLNLNKRRVEVGLPPQE